MFTFLKELFGGAVTRTVQVLPYGTVIYRGAAVGLHIIGDEPFEPRLRAGTYKVTVGAYEPSFSDDFVIVYKSKTRRLLILGGTDLALAYACVREWRKFWGGRDPDYLYFERLGD